MATESSIAVTPGSGELLDTTTVVTGAGTVKREGVYIADDTIAGARASVGAKTPDNLSYGLSVRQVGEDIFTAGFGDVGSSILDPGFSLITAGAGVGYSQAAGSLLITSGTTAKSEFLATSIQSWRGSWIARWTTILSQRIVNNNFMVLLADKIGDSLACTINSATSISVTKANHGFDSAKSIGQFMFVGGIVGALGVQGRYAIASIPDVNTINLTVAGWPASGSCTVALFGHSHIKVLYSGTTATNALFDAQRRGWASGDTTLSTVTSASPGDMLQIQVDGSNIYVQDSLRASSAAARVNSLGSRYENIPDDNLDLYAYIWAFNGTTNPATTTTWTLGTFRIEKFSNLPVFIAGTRQLGAQAPLPVSVPGNINLAAATTLVGDVGVQYRATATGASTPFAFMSLGATTPVSIKAGAGRLLSMFLQNSAVAVRSIKFFNTLVGSVTMGTTPAIYEIDIPASGSVSFVIEGGVAHSAAIVYAVTSAKGLTDNTSTGVTANDVTGLVTFA